MNETVASRVKGDKDYFNTLGKTIINKVELVQQVESAIQEGLENTQEDLKNMESNFNKFHEQYGFLLNHLTEIEHEQSTANKYIYDTLYLHNRVADIREDNAKKRFKIFLIALITGGSLSIILNTILLFLLIKGV